MFGCRCILRRHPKFHLEQSQWIFTCDVLSWFSYAWTFSTESPFTPLAESWQFWVSPHLPALTTTLCQVFRLTTVSAGDHRAYCKRVFLFLERLILCFQPTVILLSTINSAGQTHHHPYRTVQCKRLSLFTYLLTLLLQNPCYPHTCNQRSLTRTFSSLSCLKTSTGQVRQDSFILHFCHDSSNPAFNSVFLLV